MENYNDEIILKCVAIGDGATGKTSLFVCYNKNEFVQDYVPTIFENYNSKRIFEKKNVSLDLFDTSGQEDYDDTRSLAFVGASVFLIVFSLVDPPSFRNVKRWMKEIEDYYNSSNEEEKSKVRVFLIATMLDLREDPETLRELKEDGEIPITQIEGERLGRELGAYKYLECSSKTGKGVNEIFDEVMDCMINKDEKSVKGKNKKKFKGIFQIGLRKLKKSPLKGKKEIEVSEKNEYLNERRKKELEIYEKEKLEEERRIRKEEMYEKERLEEERRIKKEEMQEKMKVMEKESRKKEMRFLGDRLMQMGKKIEEFQNIFVLNELKKRKERKYINTLMKISKREIAEFKIVDFEIYKRKRELREFLSFERVQKERRRVSSEIGYRKVEKYFFRKKFVCFRILRKFSRDRAKEKRVLEEKARLEREFIKELKVEDSNRMDQEKEQLNIILERRSKEESELERIFEEKRSEILAKRKIESMETEKQEMERVRLLEKEKRGKRLLKEKRFERERLLEEKRLEKEKLLEEERESCRESMVEPSISGKKNMKSGKVMKRRKRTTMKAVKLKSNELYEKLYDERINFDRNKLRPKNPQQIDFKRDVSYRVNDCINDYIWDNENIREINKKKFPNVKSKVFQTNLKKRKKKRSEANYSPKWNLSYSRKELFGYTTKKKNLRKPPNLKRKVKSRILRFQAEHRRRREGNMSPRDMVDVMNMNRKSSRTRYLMNAGTFEPLF